MLAEAIRRGWQITPERKRDYFASLDQAIRDLPAIHDPKARGMIAASCARVLVAEQDQALKDLHHVERLDAERGIVRLKMERAEEGKPNDSLRIILPPEQPMPMPEWMKRAKGVG
jgi:hypothetical protein